MTPAPFEMTRHALSRAVDMAVDGEEIRDAFEKPREKFWSERTKSWMYTRGRITLCFVYDPHPKITTLLWARTSDWVADQQFASLPGRDDDDLSGMRRVRKAKKRL